MNNKTDNAIKPENKSKTCQRCGSKLECQSGSISLCQCKSVVLTVEQREIIAAQYDDCLCASCLRALKI